MAGDFFIREKYLKKLKKGVDSRLKIGYNNTHLFDTFGVSSERNCQKNRGVFSTKSMSYDKEVVGSKMNAFVRLKQVDERFFVNKKVKGKRIECLQLTNWSGNAGKK